MLSILQVRTILKILLLTKYKNLNILSALSVLQSWQVKIKTIVVLSAVSSLYRINFPKNSRVYLNNTSIDGHSKLKWSMKRWTNPDISILRKVSKSIWKKYSLATPMIAKSISQKKKIPPAKTLKTKNLEQQIMATMMMKNGSLGKIRPII